MKTSKLKILHQVGNDCHYFVIGYSFILSVKFLIFVLKRKITERGTEKKIPIPTAFSIIVWVQMPELFVYPWLAGKVVDLSGDEFTNMELIFASLGFSRQVSAHLHLAANRKHKLCLEFPTKEAQARADASS